jgi:hypothetical protein
MLKRLFVTAHGLELDQLRRCQKLEWLKLIFDRRVDKDWYQKLKNVIEKSLPELKTLELQERTEYLEKPKHLLFAYGKDDMVILLEKLIKKPDLLFEEQERNGK